MPRLVEILRQQTARGVGPIRDRAVGALDALETGPCLRWQDVAVEPRSDGWMLIVESTFESGRVEVFVPSDATLEVQVCSDTRSESQPFSFEELFESGRYPEATRVAEMELARLDESGEGGLAAMSAVLRVARGYASLGRYHRATLLYDRALRLLEDSDAAENETTVALLVETGNLNFRHRCNTVDEFSETESLFRRAIIIAEEVLGDRHPGFASAVVGLARLRSLEERQVEAATLLDRAEAILVDSVPPDDRRLAGVKLERARLLARTSRDKEAEAVLRELLLNAEAKLGSNHPDVAEIAFELGDVVARLGHTGEAILLLTRGLDNWERTLGHEHPLVLEQAEYLRDLVYGSDAR